MEYILQNWYQLIICLLIGSCMGWMACALFSMGERADIIMMERIAKENEELRARLGITDEIDF